MTQIIDAFEDSNTWWKGEFELEFKERDIYTEIKQFMKSPQIIALTGLRRVGKTTLMLKIIKDAFEGGFNPKHILYFSFDEFRTADIRDILHEYEKLVEVNLNNGKYLILFDEVQKLQGWEDKLKRLYDTFGKTTKIIISGSESLFIKHNSRESLAGRIFEFKIEQLSFKEFLSFNNAKFEPRGLYSRELEKSLDEFSVTLGFPQLIGVNNSSIIRKYLRESIIEKVIYRDIPGIFKVDDPTALDSLLGILMEEPGQIVDLTNLATQLGLSRQTVSQYLRYLEDSFLLRKLYNFSKNRRKTERKLKKYYPAVISANLLSSKDSLSQSKVFEWLVITQLKAEYFWRDPYKNEVDAVLCSDGTFIPAEIKYGKVDLKETLSFMNKFGINSGYIITKNTKGEKDFGKKKISLVPAYEFLLR